MVISATVIFSACASQPADPNPPVNRDLVKAPVDTEDLVDVVPEVKNTAEQINKENFDLIKNGMPLLEVEIIIAGNEQKIASVKQDGVLKETYRWETEDGKRSIEVMFADGKVSGKTQKGLK